MDEDFLKKQIEKINPSIKTELAIVLMHECLEAGMKPTKSLIPAVVYVRGIIEDKKLSQPQVAVLSGITTKTLSVKYREIIKKVIRKRE
jgi:transcription initiation factor TFIIIB Brf1 subunit/transcription initiation factor TFIIB